MVEMKAKLMGTKIAVLGIVLLSLLLLVACDSASPTSVAPTPIRATVTPVPPTVTAVLIVPTLIVPSPSPAATATPVFVATTTVAPTQPTAFLPPSQNTIPVATPVGPVTPTLLPQGVVPSLLNTQEIQVDPAIVEEVSKQLSGGNKPTIKFYVSDESVATLKSAANGIFTNAGYLAVSPFTEEEPVVAFFAKTNAPDLVFSAATIPANPPDLLKTMFNISNPSSEMSQSFAVQLRGKKSLVVLISASGLLPSIPSSTPHQP